MNKLQSFSLGFLIALFVLQGLSLWKPWQREPTFFYAHSMGEPFLMPFEVIKGDYLVLPDGRSLEIKEDEVINGVWWDLDSITVNATAHRTLFQVINDWWVKK